MHIPVQTLDLIHQPPLKPSLHCFCFSTQHFALPFSFSIEIKSLFVIKYKHESEGIWNSSLNEILEMHANVYSTEFVKGVKMYFKNYYQFLGGAFTALHTIYSLRDWDYWQNRRQIDAIFHSFIFLSITHSTSFLLRNINHTISLMQDFSRSRSSLVRPAWFTSLLARVTNRLGITRKYRGWNMNVARLFTYW